MQIWIIIGAVLIVSGVVNIILLSGNSRKPNKKGEIPTLKQIRLSRFMSVVTFFIGLYFLISNLAKL